MQSKGVIRLAAILLALACLWQLSFSLGSSIQSKKAAKYASPQSIEKYKNGTLSLEELELEMIDCGVDELFEDTEVTKEGTEYKVVVIYGDYTSYGTIQKYIEDNGYELVSGGFERIPTTELKDVTPEQRATLDKLTGLLEDDEDVTNVYTTLKPAEE